MNDKQLDGAVGAPWFIVKFGKEEHLNNLQAGKFHLRSLQWFSTREAADHQRDTNEGAALWLNPNESQILINGHKFTAEGGTLNASLSFDGPQPHVFCASVIHRKEPIREDHKIFDDRMKEFGEDFLVILNIAEFYGRLKKALASLRAKGVIEAFCAEDVLYFDERAYDGEVGTFRKSDRFQWQKEWRLAVTAKDRKEFFEFQTESLKDISSLGKTKDLINRIDSNEDGTYTLRIS
jgi:hypothetical protein